MAALKDFYHHKNLELLANEIARVHPRFARENFLKAALQGIDDLEMKARVIQIAESLRAHLPQSYPAAVHVLVDSLSPPPSEKASQENSGLSGFLVWPLTHFVQTYGLEHIDESLWALEEMTQRFTAEFAIRPFLVHAKEQTMQTMRRWARHKSEHVRRLVSEGSRPLLPWGERLQDFRKSPDETLSLLELLRWDESEYVRRSVANHLNDIAKDHPRLITTTCRRWLAESGPDHQANMKRLTRHALRGLFKSGDLDALKLFGYPPHPKVAVHGLRLASGKKSSAKLTKLKEGETLEISFQVHSQGKRPQKLMIDYVVHHMKANGKTRPKVFKLVSRQIGSGEKMPIRARHSFKSITTRRYHSGEHAIEIVINGSSFGKQSFFLHAKKTRSSIRV